MSALPDDDRYPNAGAGALGNRVTDRPVVADPDLTVRRRTAGDPRCGRLPRDPTKVMLWTAWSFEHESVR